MQFKRIESINISKEVVETPLITLSKTRGKLEISNKAAEVLNVELGTDGIALSYPNDKIYITKDPEAKEKPNTTKTGKVAKVLFAYEVLETQGTKFVLADTPIVDDHGNSWFALEVYTDSSNATEVQVNTIVDEVSVEEDPENIATATESFDFD